MPGRFPLIPVALINDRFCEDIFCGDEPEVTIVVLVTPLLVTECGGTPLLYIFNLSNPLSSNTTVNYSISGTATNGIDYTGSGVTGTRVIPAGQQQAFITIIPVFDPTTEEAETVIVTIESATSGGAPVTITTDEATGTIEECAPFLFFRWVGTVTRQLNFVGNPCTPYFDTSIVSNWATTSQDNYGTLCFAGEDPIFEGSWYGRGCREPWVANGEFGIIPGGLYEGANHLQVGRIQDALGGLNYMAFFGQSVGYFGPNNGYCLPIFAKTTGGKWQFTRDPSAPERPIGYVFPDLFEWSGR
jgi:hypothetical protein